jgi:hypothetical protein
VRLEVEPNLINVSDTLDSNLLDGEAWVVLKRWVVVSFKFEVRNPHKPFDALGLVAIVDCHEDARRDQKGSELNLGDVINSFRRIFPIYLLTKQLLKQIWPMSWEISSWKIVLSRKLNFYDSLVSSVYLSARV